MLPHSIATENIPEVPREIQEASGGESHDIIQDVLTHLAGKSKPNYTKLCKSASPYLYGSRPVTLFYRMRRTSHSFEGFLKGHLFCLAEEGFF